MQVGNLYDNKDHLWRLQQKVVLEKVKQHTLSIRVGQQLGKLVLQQLEFGVLMPPCAFWESVRVEVVQSNIVHPLFIVTVSGINLEIMI